LCCQKRTHAPSIASRAVEDDRGGFSCSLGNSTSRCIMAFSRSSAERMRWSHPAESKRRSQMNTEMRESTMNTGELTDDELDRVTGGLDRLTASAILNGLAAIPVIGVVTQVTRAAANAVTGYNL
jgi:hypothetical protein